jgi:hypothetical protein
VEPEDPKTKLWFSAFTPQNSNYVCVCACVCVCVQLLVELQDLARPSGRRPAQVVQVCVCVCVCVCVTHLSAPAPHMAFDLHRHDVCGCLFVCVCMCVCGYHACRCVCGSHAHMHVHVCVWLSCIYAPVYVVWLTFINTHASVCVPSASLRAFNIHRYALLTIRGARVCVEGGSHVGRVWVVCGSCVDLWLCVFVCVGGIMSGLRVGRVRVVWGRMFVWKVGCVWVAWVAHLCGFMVLCVCGWACFS